MGPLDLWTAGQAEMSALGRTLSDAEADRVVPACPDWTVKDVYAHMAGVAADLLSGRLEGVATDPWTATHVADRADRTLAAILDEWDGAAPQLVEALAPLGDAVDARLVVDLWSHGQDVRGAVGCPGDRDGELARWVADGLRAYAQSRFRSAGLDPATVAFPGEDADAGAAVVVDRFELARAGVGRRSAAQVAGWAWTVDDAGPYVTLVPVFPLRPDPLEEPA